MFSNEFYFKLPKRSKRERLRTGAGRGDGNVHKDKKHMKECIWSCLQFTKHDFLKTKHELIELRCGVEIGGCTYSIARLGLTDIVKPD